MGIVNDSSPPRMAARSTSADSRSSSRRDTVAFWLSLIAIFGLTDYIDTLEWQLARSLLTKLAIAMSVMLIWTVWFRWGRPRSSRAYQDTPQESTEGSRAASLSTPIKIAIRLYAFATLVVVLVVMPALSLPTWLTLPFLFLLGSTYVWMTWKLRQPRPPTAIDSTLAIVSPSTEIEQRRQ